MTVKILVVDDEPDLELLILQKFRKQIASREYAFVFARHGKEALEKLSEDPELNVIMTDINMPEMDGIALLSHLSSLNRPYKAIVISAYGDMPNIRSAMNQGASEFITKPIDFQDLEITINKIIKQYDQLKEGVSATNQLRTLEVELSIANNIQQSLLPCNFNLMPQNLHFELVGKMNPAKAVGGDFFDFFALDDTRLGMLIADVSGKSIPASLFMAKSKTIIRSIALQGASPQDTLRTSNDLISSDNSSSMFVTLFYAILDTSTGLVTYANAGHPPPYIISPNNVVRRLPVIPSTPLGLDPDLVKNCTPLFEQRTIALKDQEFIFLYTDGVTEAMNSSGELYSYDRLEKILAQTGSSPLADVIETTIADIKKFIGASEQSDDIAILCTRYYQEQKTKAVAQPFKVLIEA